MKKLIIISLLVLTAVLIAQTGRLHVIDRPTKIEGWLQTQGDVWPLWSGKYDIGKTGYRWDSLFVNDIWCYTIRVDSGGTLAGLDSIITENLTVTDSTTLNKVTVQGKAAFEDDIETDGFIRNARIQSIDSLPPDSITGYVTFTFDDNHESVYDSVFPVFTDSGAVGVLAIVTSYAGTSGKMTWAETKEMYDAGWEIASHSAAHPNFTTISKDSADKELRYSRDTLTAQGIVAKSFVYPGGLHDEIARRLTAQYYNCARAGGSGGTGREISPINTFALKSVVLNQNSEVAAAKAQIDTAATDHSWLIFMTHTISGGAGYDIRRDSIASMINYAEDAGLQIVTLQQGLKYMGNKIDVGDGNFVVGKNGYIGAPKANTYSFCVWRNETTFGSGTQNTISAHKVLDAIGGVSFDSLIVDSVFAFAYMPEDSNKIDSLYLYCRVSRTLLLKTIIADGTDWGAAGYCSHTYILTSKPVIPTALVCAFQFKPKAESAANKANFANIIIYGHPK